jgi:hypothetical protein
LIRDVKQSFVFDSGSGVLQKEKITSKVVPIATQNYDSISL